MLSTRTGKYRRIPGSGLIAVTGDDDPVEMVTYSPAGAGFGAVSLWRAMITFPLMAALKELTI